MTTDNHSTNDGTQAIYQVTAAGAGIAAACPPVAAAIAVVAVGAGIAYGIYSLFADDDDSVD